VPVPVADPVVEPVCVYPWSLSSVVVVVVVVVVVMVAQQ
jgi:hypothetical protein